VDRTEFLLSDIFLPVSILGEKPEAIVPGQDDILDDGQHAFIFEPKWFSTHDRTVHHLYAHRIYPEFVGYFHWVRLVLFGFRHLFAVSSQN